MLIFTEGRILSCTWSNSLADVTVGYPIFTKIRNMRRLARNLSTISTQFIIKNPPLRPYPVLSILLIRAMYVTLATCGPQYVRLRCHGAPGSSLLNGIPQGFCRRWCQDRAEKRYWNLQYHRPCTHGVSTLLTELVMGAAVEP